MRTTRRSAFLATSLLFLGATLMLAAGPAGARPPFVATWQSLFPGSSSDDHVINGTGVGCQLCHVEINGGDSWNGYGWRIRQNMLAGQSITNAILNSQSFDSDMDPTASSNQVEIGASTQPGWTPGPSNTHYFDTGSTLPGQMPPPGIQGSLDPTGPGVAMCVPGSAGIMACVCNNANGAGRGCANTGSSGAILSSSGVASLASDSTDPGSVSLTGTDMRSGSTAIFLQGNAEVAGGTTFGAGIRCAGGSLKRLYVKSLVGTGGTKAAPEAGDRSISNRSADLADVILAGSMRWYQTYYRDPGLPNPGGACPTIATFNITSGQRITWN